jgi:hypothetical protein
MSEFTASNGVTITIDNDNPYGRRLLVSRGDLVVNIIGGPRIDALREFFRAEEDERLGRWRWPENPDYVVYGDDIDCDVLYEPGGGVSHWTRAESRDGADRYPSGAAKAFFDTHPEPKPWHDAKPGEVWVLDASEHSGPHGVVESDAFTGGVGFRNALTGKRGPGINAPIIKSATLIYTPEVQS